MEPLAGSIIMSLLYKGNGILFLCC
jgi:hypothetical protein